MKISSIILIMFFGIGLIISGCAIARDNTHPAYTYKYPLINEPTTVEGKRCVIECKKVKLLELELYEKQNQYRSINSDRQRKVEAEFWQIEPRYDQCILDCGGKEAKVE